MNDSKESVSNDVGSIAWLVFFLLVAQVVSCNHLARIEKLVGEGKPAASAPLRDKE